MEFDADKGSTKASGFYLHCARCSTDYRFTDGLQCLGQAEQKAENT